MLDCGSYLMSDSVIYLFSNSTLNSYLVEV